jgi:hypothetical protein
MATKISTDPDHIKSVGQRISMAHNRKTKESDLRKLAKDAEITVVQEEQNRWVRQGVAKNLQCPNDLLERLAKDEHWTVRNETARNVTCPSDLLAKLATDENDVVRYHVGRNPNTNKKTIALLVKDKDPIVAKWAARHELAPVAA